MARGPSIPNLDTLRPARATVNLARLRHNLGILRAFAGIPLMPVLKADAYGHGAARVALEVESLGVPLVAVAYPEEGLALRAAGVQIPIVVLAGFERGQVEGIIRGRLVPVVSTPGNLEALLERAGEGRGLGVHVKVDTGMGRLGFSPEAFIDAALRLAEAGFGVEGVLTQLATADVDRDFTMRQLDRFDTALADLAARGLRPRWVHAANSAGLAYLRPNQTLARPGLLLYGARPRPLSPDVPVSPVMTVSARIAMVKDVPAGTPVSYGGRWVAPRPSQVATIPLGYADGIPRSDAMAQNGAFVVGGRRAPVAGTVCMDLTLADVTGLSAAVGDEAVLFGDAPTVWEVSEHAGTTAWQVLTAVGSRLPRVYVDGGQIVAVESRYV